MEIEWGGPSLMDCIERNIRNHEKDLRQQQVGQDIETLIEHFTFKREKNPNIFCDYNIDLNNRMLRCFWVDS